MISACLFIRTSRNKVNDTDFNFCLYHTSNKRVEYYGLIISRLVKTVKKTSHRLSGKYVGNTWINKCIALSPFYITKSSLKARLFPTF